MDKCPVCGLEVNDLGKHLEFAHQEKVVMLLEFDEMLATVVEDIEFGESRILPMS